MESEGVQVFDSVMTGIELIANERQRQVEVEGWTLGHDDEHDLEQLVDAAEAYLCWDDVPKPMAWPWDEESWKPTTRIQNLAKAGALIAAEIDRLQRLEEKR